MIDQQNSGLLGSSNPSFLDRLGNGFNRISPEALMAWGAAMSEAGRPKPVGEGDTFGSALGKANIAGLTAQNQGRKNDFEEQMNAQKLQQMRTQADMLKGGMNYDTVEGIDKAIAFNQTTGNHAATGPLIQKRMELVKQKQDQAQLAQMQSTPYTMAPQNPSDQSIPTLQGDMSSLLAQAKQLPEGDPDRVAIESAFAQQNPVITQPNQGYVRNSLAGAQSPITQRGIEPLAQLVDSGTLRDPAEVFKQVNALQSTDRMYTNNQNTIAGAKDRSKQGAGGDLSQEQSDALNTAIQEKRIDPYKVNSKTAKFYANMELSKPGTDWQGIGADSALGRNPTFRTKAITIEALPEIMSNMVETGKKLDFSDVRALGKMKAWTNGQLNDPTYTEYMVQRNDALMTIAGVMRGVGMSDQAHRAEIEVANPAMSPNALDSWMAGQMKSLEPRLKKYRAITGDKSTTEATTGKVRKYNPTTGKIE